MSTISAYLKCLRDRRQAVLRIRIQVMADDRAFWTPTLIERESSKAASKRPAPRDTTADLVAKQVD